MAFGEELHVEHIAGQTTDIRMGRIEPKHLADLPEQPDKVTHFLTQKFAANLDSLRRGGEHYQYIADDPSNLHWGIFAADKLIGMTGVRGIGAEDDDLPIMRIALLDPRFMGAGHGNTATMARTWALFRVYQHGGNRAAIHQDNIASLRAAQRFGYRVLSLAVKDNRSQFSLVQHNALLDKQPAINIGELHARRLVLGALTLGNICIRSRSHSFVSPHKPQPDTSRERAVQPQPHPRAYGILD